MIHIGNIDERHAIPRWNDLATASILGELSSSVIIDNKRALPSSNIDSLLLSWKKEKNLPLAVEIMAENEHSEEPRDIKEIIDYAKKAAKNMVTPPDILDDFIQNVDDVGPRHSLIPLTVKKDIRTLRHYLYEFPRNPLMWIELGREFLICGEVKKSEKALSVAYSLSPNNRTVLRAYARFYSHQRDYEKALYILRRAESLKYDPWVLSAEISISNEIGKTSRLIKNAQRMLDNKQYSPHALSELGSELATLDFFSANSKHGRKKIERIATNPHENAFAQIVWINDRVYNISSILEQTKIPECDYEAEVMVQYREENYSAALESAKKWANYQPFSGEPVMRASYLLCDFLQRYQEAVDLLQPIITNNQNRADLLNNYAYALIMLGRMEEASYILLKAKGQTQNHTIITLEATEGLWLYRSGCQKQGYEKYQDAISLAKKEKDNRTLYELYLHLAREEMIAGNNYSQLMEIINDPRYYTFRRELNTMIENFGLE